MIFNAALISMGLVIITKAVVIAFWAGRVHSRLNSLEKEIDDSKKNVNLLFDKLDEVVKQNNQIITEVQIIRQAVGLND